MTSPQAWEVWHARFDYEGGGGYKYRPVTVVTMTAQAGCSPSW